MAMREREIRHSDESQLRRFTMNQFSLIAQKLDLETHTKLFQNRELGLISMNRVAQVMNAIEEFATGHGTPPETIDLAHMTRMTVRQAAAHLYVGIVLYAHAMLTDWGKQVMRMHEYHTVHPIQSEHKRR